VNAFCINLIIWLAHPWLGLLPFLVVRRSYEPSASRPPTNAWWARPRSRGSREKTEASRGHEIGCRCVTSFCLYDTCNFTTLTFLAGEQVIRYCMRKWIRDALFKRSLSNAFRERKRAQALSTICSLILNISEHADWHSNLNSKIGINQNIFRCISLGQARSASRSFTVQYAIRCGSAYLIGILNRGVTFRSQESEVYFTCRYIVQGR